MKDLKHAIIEEKLYVADRLNNIQTSLVDRLKDYGYDNLEEYFIEKQEYLFNNWKPEVYYVDVKTLTTELEAAVQNGKYGIYISTSDGLYAFHGTDKIDYELCKDIGITVAELYHNGGTIIGSNEDLGIEIIAPKELQLNSKFMLDKFYEIIKQYEPSAVITENDILVNDEKVLGSMSRNVGNAFVWAAQISFGEYNDIIEKVCSKKSIKKPGRIKHNQLTKKKLEREVLKWLQKL